MIPGGSEAAEIVLRPLREADIARVIEIASALPHAPHWPREAYRTALDPAALPRRVALAAEALNARIQKTHPEASALVGFAVASVLLPQAELETIAVEAQGQHRGIGRLLLTALLQELRAAGVSEVLLEARASNAPALGLYAAVGFQRTGVRPKYYADPQEDGVLMALQFLSLPVQQES